MFVINNIATLAEIPAFVASFAGSLGWGVDASDPLAPVVTRPGGGLPITMTGSDGGVNSLGVFELASTANPGFVARVNNIRINGPRNAPETPTPTRLFLFGGTESGEAFISAVIEFGFNRYRMFYLGSMIRKGNYTGGEVVAANSTLPLADDTASFVDVTSNKFLFGGTSFQTTARAGWVRVEHPDSLTEFKPFSSSVSGIVDPVANIDEGSVIGGNFDNVNDTLLTHGQQHFAAATLINPVNLYEGFGDPRRLRPLGHPAGARSVNMTNLEPGQQVLVGSDNWRVFPEFRRSDEIRIESFGDNSTFALDESSTFAGMAFPEDLTT